MFWTNEEDSRLRELYPITSNKELAKMFNRTIKAIKCRAVEVLKVSKNNVIPRCLYCEKPINNPVHYQRFCCDECREFFFRNKRAERNYNNLQKRRVARKCLCCHKSFVPKRSKGTFCSVACQNKYWRETHKEQHQLTLRARWEKNYLKIRDKNRIRTIKSSNGAQSFTVIKRNFPIDGCCELCGKKQIKLPYHHWGEIKDYELLAGIWVCINCHKIIENPEHSFHVLTLFAQKKEQIDKEIEELKTNIIIKQVGNKCEK
jgi:predicted nucleic acid-binding Zn ribbon protein